MSQRQEGDGGAQLLEQSERHQIGMEFSKKDYFTYVQPALESRRHLFSRGVKTACETMCTHYGILQGLIHDIHTLYILINLLL